MNDIVLALKSGVVVDRAKLNKLPADKVTELLTQVYTKNEAKEVTFVDNTVTFLTEETLLSLLQQGDSKVQIVADYFGLNITPEDMATLQAAIEVTNSIRQHLDTIMESRRPEYKFAPTPAGWDGAKALNIGKVVITRTVNNEGYQLGLKTAQALWNNFSKAWVGDKKSASRFVSVRSSGYTRYGQLGTHDDRECITIGCQRVYRYELEYVAKKLGWDFPKGPRPSAKSGERGQD